WLESCRMRAPVRTAAVHAHLPGRTMADDRVLLVARDVVGGHPGEEIVGVVVLTHVIEAEAPVFVVAGAPLGRPIDRGAVAARPFTARVLGPQPAIPVGLDPDAVEQGRVV